MKEMLPFDFSIIHGWDAAGIIAKVGENVSNFKVGDRVYTRPATTSQGTYAEFVPEDQELIAKVPRDMNI